MSSKCVTRQTMKGGLLGIDCPKLPLSIAKLHVLRCFLCYSMTADCGHAVSSLTLSLVFVTIVQPSDARTTYNTPVHRTATRPSDRHPHRTRPPDRHPPHPSIFYLDRYPSHPSTVNFLLSYIHSCKVVETTASCFFRCDQTRHFTTNDTSTRYSDSLPQARGV